MIVFSAEQRNTEAQSSRFGTSRNKEREERDSTRWDDIHRTSRFEKSNESSRTDLRKSSTEHLDSGSTKAKKLEDSERETNEEWSEEDHFGFKIQRLGTKGRLYRVPSHCRP